MVVAGGEVGLAEEGGLGAVVFMRSTSTPAASEKTTIQPASGAADPDAVALAVAEALTVVLPTVVETPVAVPVAVVLEVPLPSAERWTETCVNTMWTSLKSSERASLT
jgi:hypothetical protein